MKSIPILFSTPMVQALLDNRKTQTRRLRGLDKINENPDEWTVANYFPNDGEMRVEFYRNGNPNDFYMIKCPYGIKGDRLWVREAWNYLNAEKVNGKYQVCYRATDENDVTGSAIGTVAKWKPSIHMPRWASRITLENTVNPRIERLQDIRRNDAIAEGITEYIHQFKDKYTEQEDDEWRNRTSVENYKWLWESLNGEGSWDKNPYVWVVEFKKVGI